MTPALEGNGQRPHSAFGCRLSISLWSTVIVTVATVWVALASPPDARAADDTAKPTLAEQAQAILAEIERLESDVGTANKQSLAAQDSQSKAVAELQKRNYLFDWMHAVGDLVTNVLAQQEAGEDARVYLQKARKLLMALDRRIPRFIDDTTAENLRLRDALANSEPAEAEGLESLLLGSEETLDETVRFYLSYIQYLERLELSSEKARAKATPKLERRGSNLSARLELASQRLGEIKSRAGQASAAESTAEVTAAQELVDRTAASLWTTLDVMDELELPTASYRKVLILATGDISTDLLDVEVAGDIVEDIVEEARRWLARRGPILVGRATLFAIVVSAFWLLGLFVRSVSARIAKSSKTQISVLGRNIFVEGTYRLVVLIGLLVALAQIGINVTALLTGLGIAGFIIGFALQETLGNFAAGAMIIFYRPFDLGDVIEAAGENGTVHDMNLVSTTILTFDHQALIVPNSRIWGNVIRNSTARDERRVDLEFPLALDSDIEAAEALFDDICRHHPAVLETPEPAIKIHKLSSEGILFVVRPWVRTEDYWQTYWDLNREAQRRLTKAGLRIAPTRFELESPDRESDR